MPHNAAYGIVAIQSLFFFLGGIRDNFMTGKTIMPDEEYLQSWFYDTKLGDSENHSERMEVIANCWGSWIATLALIKIAVALTGGQRSTLSRTLAMIFIVGNAWVILKFLPAQQLMEDHWTDKKNNKEMTNKGNVMPFIALMAIECVLWPVAQDGIVDFNKIKID